MHRSIAAAAAVVTLTATLVACGGSDEGSKAGPTKNTGSSGAAKPGGEQTPDAGPGSAQPPVGKLGDTLALEGSPTNLDSKGTGRADFTLKRYVDRAQAKVDYFKAPAGERLVAAEFTIVNTGQGTYHYTPYNEAKVVDSTGKSYVGKPGSPTAGESLDIPLILRPGKQAAGWVIFNVPEDVKITALTYQMDANGLDEERMGKWTLG
ncbi:DUF4352 domain-containing protein [Streptomyces coffeae]|uniref:DUF4352 domain-containing protein n=1 Tax=Streptomyces coffeae TaxID=621382 RepID=A0ABS1N8H1_9ACTN|nr:DUF4352 domain-containing protein [Streptomyces coffeae]MBL1096363.1 DUF4352 domain-containing protein [Streptomyces coffeae]